MDQILKDDLSVLALPLFAIAIGLEIWWSWGRQPPKFYWRDSLVSIWLLLATAIIEILPRAAALMTFAYLHELSPLREFLGRQWWAWLLLFFLDDFCYYWFHRMNHQVRILWAGHVNHHSSQYMNLGTALRQGVGERLHKYLFWMWLPLLGFDPLMIITMMSISLFYQFWVHTESVRRLPGLFEAVFNTPSHHRVHHGSNVRYLDRNHAGVLILWDKWFGTFAAEVASEPVVYGLTKNINTYHLGRVLTHEYQALWRDVRRASQWHDKARYFLRAPGWSHDGPDRRSNVLRRNALSTLDG